MMNKGFLGEYIKRAFDTPPRISSDNIASRISLGRSEFFGKFIIFKSQCEWGIPAFLWGVANNYHPSEIRFQPFYVKGKPRKHFNSVIREWFWGTDDRERLTRIETSDGGVYYGGRGYIFDKDFKPLMIFYFKRTGLSSRSCIIRVSSSVLTTNKMVERGIRQQILPLATKLYPRCTPDQTIKIVVDDFKEEQLFICKAPEVGFDQEILHRVLENNISDIQYSINNNER